MQSQAKDDQSSLMMLLAVSGGPGGEGVGCRRAERGWGPPALGAGGGVFFGKGVWSGCWNGFGFGCGEGVGRGLVSVFCLWKIFLLFLECLFFSSARKSSSRLT